MPHETTSSIFIQISRHKLLKVVVNKHEINEAIKILISFIKLQEIDTISTIINLFQKEPNTVDSLYLTGVDMEISLNAPHKNLKPDIVLDNTDKWLFDTLIKVENKNSHSPKPFVVLGMDDKEIQHLQSEIKDSNIILFSKDDVIDTDTLYFEDEIVTQVLPLAVLAAETLESISLKGDLPQKRKGTGSHKNRWETPQASKKHSQKPRKQK